MAETSFCPLSVDLLSYKRDKYMNVEDYIFPAYENVIRSLFDASIQAFVYRGTSEEHEGAFGELVGKPIDMKREDILIPHKGKYRFDKTKECITGHEYLWHARSYKRGSIVLILPNDFDFSAVFTYCYSPSFDETPHMGQSPGAIKYYAEKQKIIILQLFLVRPTVLRLWEYMPPMK
ncbi:hypothetical protein [Paenibacillus elgii]|uniref:hypothetical protein n=1 Tax=Paenibacillus elgii TaxID=189691 RepID=UPI00203F8C82|nr:hypothetical protein [Paenibacillus elgii]MCM3270634.1 hypothetical protein [Paenibacillus elgii]